MIRILIKKNKSIQEVNVKGHSDYAEYGSDIVCAAASALFIATINGLEEVVGLKHLDYNAESGNAKLVMPVHLSQNEREKAELLLKTLELAYLDLQESYPEDVSVYIEEGE